jgi:hypothetical protein
MSGRPPTSWLRNGPPPIVSYMIALFIFAAEVVYFAFLGCPAVSVVLPSVLFGVYLTLTIRWIRLHSPKPLPGR